MDNTSLAKGIGWLSIGLGVLDLFVPRKVNRAVGGTNDTLVRAVGIREIGAGAGLLATKHPGPWLWSRVAGDVMDLAALGRTLRKDNPRRKVAIAVLGTMAAITIVDLMCASKSGKSSKKDELDRAGAT